MPMPHADMKRLIQKRLRGTDGAERLRVARECMSMLPGYKQGPYADLRKWLAGEMETTQKRRDTRHADGAFVARDGDARIVLLGPPNAGKSSLLKSLCRSSVQVGDYAFTTLKPIAATCIVNETRIQLVEIPGLIEGAKDNRGGGHLYLGAARDADGYLLVMPLDEYTAFERMLSEVESIIENRPVLIVATKADLPGSDSALAEAITKRGSREIVAVSTATGQGLSELALTLWKMTGLMRVYSREESGPIARPFIVPLGYTVQDLASHIHNELADGLEKAAVWGPSAKFPGQVVGRDHVLLDSDAVKLFKRR